MKDKKFDIEKITRELIQKESIQQPGSDFTKNLMARILKDPAVQVSYIKEDESRNNILLFLLIAVLFIAYIGYIIYENGLGQLSEIDKMPGMTYLYSASNFFTKLWSEISLSPYIILSFVGIILLLIFDKYIVKYLYSI